MTAAVVLYTREGCHLCNEARAELGELESRLPPFELEEVDIETDERLHAAFLERIPVFEVAGTLVCELGLDPEALALALAEAGSGARYPEGR